MRKMRDFEFEISCWSPLVLQFQQNKLFPNPFGIVLLRGQIGRALSSSSMDCVLIMLKPSLSRLTRPVSSLLRVGIHFHLIHRA